MKNERKQHQNHFCRQYHCFPCFEFGVKQFVFILLLCEVLSLSSTTEKVTTARYFSCNYTWLSFILSTIFTCRFKMSSHKIVWIQWAVRQMSRSAVAIVMVLVAIKCLHTPNDIKWCPMIIVWMLRIQRDRSNWWDATGWAETKNGYMIMRYGVTMIKSIKMDSICISREASPKTFQEFPINFGCCFNSISGAYN